MSEHKCKALVVGCFDFRLQEYIENWCRENIGVHKYDRLSIAGGVFDFDYVYKQLEISIRLHQIEKIILINHENCGAYGDAGTYERHRNDLSNARKTIEKEFLQLKVETYYLHLDGRFEEV